MRGERISRLTVALSSILPVAPVFDWRPPVRDAALLPEASPPTGRCAPTLRVGLIRLAGAGTHSRSCAVVKSAIANSPASNPAIGSDAVLRLEQDVRQLKETVLALRLKLEEAQAGRDQAVQDAVAGAHDEIRQLRDTVRTLREEMQTLQAEKDRAVQVAVATGSDAGRQLQQTIAALRSALETALAQAQADREALVRASDDEQRQLRQTIVALRDEWEAPHGR